MTYAHLSRGCGWIAASALVLAGGCSDFGTGGTGEKVIPSQVLHDIAPARLESFSSTTRPSTRPTTAAAVREVPLSIEECRQMALANNLDIRVQLLAPTIAREALGAEEARYELLFTSSINHATTDSPTYTQLQSTTGNSLAATAGLSLPLQTGGTLSFDVPISRSESNNSFSLLNPAYTSNYVFTISHPLLRGFGLETNAQPIRLAFYAYQQSQAQTKLQITQVLSDVDRTYWRVYAARRELEVRKQEYDLAVAQLDRARRQVKAGAAAEVEIARAEAGVSDQLEQVILAQSQLRDRQRELKRILNEPGMQMNSPVAIVPTTEPSALFLKLDPGRVVQVAQKQRMEMIELELQLASDTSSVAVARNATLPLVDLQYRYRLNGLGPDLSQSFSQTSSNQFTDNEIGVSIQVPIGNEAARSRLRQALAARMQTLNTREARAAAIEQEVLGAIDTLETNWERIIAARKRVLLNARLLELETRQFLLGLRTSTDVLDAQTKLANAQSSEIAAITEYQIAQVDIAFATGTLLGASHIVWEAAPRPRE